MSLINGQLAYLKGLVDGLEVDAATKEGKAILAILDVLDEMALVISDLENVVGEYFDMNDEEEFSYDIYSCPTCGISIEVDEGMLAFNEGLCCPKCGDPIELEEDYDFGCECDCGCDHHEGHDHN